ncbi:MAG: hypothetical protein AMXMBFR59_22430 [Rhodanobacteraceae bacterium]
MATQIPGGWSNFDFTLSPEAKNVFDTAFDGLLGVKYTPFAFATQIVNGTNYSFLCEAQYMTRYPVENAVAAEVYQPLEGKPHIVAIRPISPGG